MSQDAASDVGAFPLGAVQAAQWLDSLPADRGLIVASGPEIAAVLGLDELQSEDADIVVACRASVETALRCAKNDVIVVEPALPVDDLRGVLKELAGLGEMISVSAIAGVVTINLRPGRPDPSAVDTVDVLEVLGDLALQLTELSRAFEQDSRSRERNLRQAVQREHSGARKQLEQLRTLHTSELRQLRASSRYVLGDVVISGIRNPRSLRSAPKRLREVFTQRARRAPGLQIRELDLPPRTEVMVGAVLDEFSWDCFAPEARLVELDPARWSDQLEATPIDMLFVESAWRGNRGKWNYAVNRFASREPNHLAALIEHARASGVPTVFWNKEDPVGFEVFLDAARAFQAVLTTDLDMVPEYIDRLGHADVAAMPFAAQPRLHNPMGSRDGVLSRVCFSGSWRGDKYEQRSNDFRVLLDPAMEREVLDIYDRYAGYKDADKLRFPEPYRSAVVGSLPYPKMVEAYRRYSAFLNVNSVTQSPTMFSRRVFELLACGTPVITTPSRGIEEMLGDHVDLVRTPAQTGAALDVLLWDVESRERKGHLGYRFVHQHHTYRERFAQIADIAGVELPSEGRPDVTVICASNRPEHLEHAIDSYRRQRFEPSEFIFVANADSFDRDEVLQRIGELDRGRALFLPEECRLADCLNAAIEIAEGDYIAKFDDDDDYGTEFLGDMMLTFEYSGCAIAGKKSYYAYMEAGDRTVLRFPGQEFRKVSSVIGGTLVFDRRATADISFTPVRAGTDTLFLQACRDVGLSVFSGDRYNFVQHRHADLSRHTWRIADDEFLEVAEDVGPGYQDRRVFI